MELTSLDRGMQDSLPRIEEVSDFTTPVVKAFLGRMLYLYLDVSESAVSEALV